MNKILKQRLVDRSEKIDEDVRTINVKIIYLQNEINRLREKRADFLFEQKQIDKQLEVGELN